MVGHIKLDRKILNWEWYQDANTSRLFIHLLLIANYKNGRWMGNEILRGQLITGLKELSKQTGLSIMQVRTCFDKLKLTKEITVKVTNKFRVVTICKYDVYQSFNNEDNNQNNIPLSNQVTNKQQTDNKQVTTNNNDNNNNKEGNKAKEEGVFSIFENPKIWDKERQYFFDDGKWIFKFCTDKNISVDFFDEKAKEFISDIELKGDYKSKLELQKHFLNWFNLKKNGTHKQSTTTNKFTTGTEKLLAKGQRVYADIAGKHGN